MNMRRLYIPTIIALLFVASVAAAGDKPAASTSPDQRVLPVLVQVNAKGQVTNATPAIKLTPSLQGLLEKTLSRMITKPAHDAKGKPIASQLIIKLALHAKMRTDGSLNASFAYLSAKTVPSGNWYWAHVGQNRKLVLMNRNNGNTFGRALRASQLRQAYANMAPGSGG